MSGVEHQVTAQPHTLGRRHLLSLAAGSVGATALGATPLGNAASAQPRPEGFALLGDTHVGVTVPERTGWTRWVYEHILARDASAVCHVGDIMDYGSVDEYDAYLSTIPDDLFERVHHVPGNHDWRWDPTARERYRELLGQSRYSFDAAGIRFIALDPSHLLQEGGGFGEHGMEWLLHELEQAPDDQPIVMMCHFPIGFDNYYVSDQQRILEILQSYNVRAWFAGHIHNEQIHQFNGVTQLAVNGTLNAPLYYWLERITGPDGPALKVSEVRRADHPAARTLRRYPDHATDRAPDPAGHDPNRGAVDPDDDEVIVREVGTIPLGGERIAQHQRPLTVDLEPTRGSLTVSVRLRSRAAGSLVEAQLYPQHTYAMKNPGDWQALTPDDRGRRFTGTLDTSALAPGAHRMSVKVHGDDVWHEETHNFAVPGADRVVWHVELGAPVQAGLAAHADLLVATTSAGVVVGGRVTGSGLDERWTREIGGVKGRPVFTEDGATVFVPSVDHHIHALDAATGETRFTYDAGEPVLGSPLLSEIDGTPVVVCPAGESVHVIDAETGTGRWSANDLGMFVGRAAADGNRIYTGGGDGRAYAFDASSGAVVWSFLTNTQQESYRRLIYGPWYDNVELLTESSVLVSTVQNGFALDVETGEELWRIPGSYVFAPKKRLSDSELLLIDDWARTVSSIDPATGDVRWTTNIGVRALNTGAALHNGVAWVHGTTGQLTGVDVHTGDITERLQLTATANCYSAPAVAGDVLVVGDQDGVLHGVTLP
ncbi:PQQ-binding-like beta-propeller repeat protein [Phytoactinopolyspora mesophila]|uniref:PQQ-binding-like beta-propeller repeat protein n=1 Tax=Phytoactinopolyspora mesophila TaxID=2650750 RepID=A0A7K3LZD0_9ACTN|nr:PQQ-binding-like beta-propeller repeat protein [Phytoactinopolyspora mesophila]NDL56167.1 PQQ-binding-like beta-propeller repeat protein [Phytoactinopolyspora mesophila]